MAYNGIAPENQYLSRLAVEDHDRLIEITSSGGKALVAKWGANHPALIKGRAVLAAKRAAAKAEQAEQNGGE
jgi:hypothetical protein